MQRCMRVRRDQESVSLVCSKHVCLCIVQVSLVYIITSVNQVEEAETLPALILLYSALLGSILTSAGRNIRHLQVQHGSSPTSSK